MRKRGCSFNSLPHEVLVLIAMYVASPYHLVETSKRVYLALKDAPALWPGFGSWSALVDHRRKLVTKKLDRVRAFNMRSEIPDLLKRVCHLELVEWQVDIDGRRLPLKSPIVTELAISFKLVFNTLKVKSACSITVHAKSGLLKQRESWILKGAALQVGSWDDGTVSCVLATISLADILRAFDAFKPHKVIESIANERLLVELALRDGDGSVLLLRELFTGIRSAAGVFTAFEAESGRVAEITLQRKPSINIACGAAKYSWDMALIDICVYCEAWPEAPCVSVSHFATVKPLHALDFDFRNIWAIKVNKDSWLFEMEFGVDVDDRIALKRLLFSQT